MKDIRQTIRLILEEHEQSNVKKQINFNPSKYTSFSKLTEQDLIDIARWGLEGQFEYSGAWDDTNNDINKAINNIVRDFKWELKTPIPIGFGNFPNKIIAYRLIALNTPDSLRKNNLGKSWFVDKNKIEDPYFTEQLQHLHKNIAGEDDKKIYLITAEIPQNKVDIPISLFRRSLNSTENELALKNDSNIKIISLEEFL